MVGKKSSLLTMPVVGKPRPAGDISEVYYAKDKNLLEGQTTAASFLKIKHL